jgi:tRNA threonylcarbamoyladenosine biosynthesis protein TsaE
MKFESQKEYVYDLDKVSDVAASLLKFVDCCSVFTFTGPLGVGKSTIIRHMLSILGVEGPVTSPTFTYVNVYANEWGKKFYHFDLYRIPSLDDFCQAGFDEYLFQPNSWAFIEWPEPIMPLLMHDTCHVFIDYYNGERKISVLKNDNAA